jgi:hypothetical protein
LPNGNILPTAGISAESSEEIFPRRTEFVTKFGPQISLLLVPIFGVNTNFLCHFYNSLEEPTKKQRSTPEDRKISSKHLNLGNDHIDMVPSRVQNPRTTRPKQHLKTLIQQLGHKKQIVPK